MLALHLRKNGRAVQGAAARDFPAGLKRSQKGSAIGRARPRPVSDRTNVLIYWTHYANFIPPCLAVVSRSLYVDFRRGSIW